MLNTEYNIIKLINELRTIKAEEVKITSNMRGEYENISY